MFLLLIVALLAVGGWAPAQAAEAPEMLLNESFDAVAEGQLPPGWDVQGGKWTVSGGRLRGEASGALSKILCPVPPLQDVAIEAEVAFEKVAEPTRWLALLARNPEGAPEPHLQFTHRFQRSRASGIEIGRLLKAGNRPVWSVLARKSADIPDRTNEVHHIRLEVRGCQAKGYIDGKLAIEQVTLADAGISGRVGLILSGVTATFDNVRVSRLPALSQAEASKLLDSTRGGPLVIAHRGDSANAPENTLAAIRQAIELGVDMVEVDVRLSKDGVAVLMHDDTVDRTTNGKGKVSDLTLAELKALDAGSRKDPKYAGERIPTLEEVCQLVKGKVPLVLDLKGNNLAPQIAEALSRTGMADRVVAACWSPAQAASMRQAVPGILCVGLVMTGSALKDADSAYFAKRFEEGMRGLSCNAGAVTPQFVRAARLRSMPVYAWTVNDPGTMEWMTLIGVDGIYTDDPRLLLETIARLRERTYPGLAAPRATN